MKKPDGIIACICEGPDEKAIINLLLDNDKLIFTRYDILEHEPIINFREAREFEKRYLGKKFDKPITIFRFLDSRRENYRLSKQYQSKVDVINVITAPEIEMLLIISLGLVKEYEKVKSTTKPSIFCKQALKRNDIKSTAFINDFYGDVDKLVYAIREYQRIKEIKRGEICLAELLNS